MKSQPRIRYEIRVCDHCDYESLPRQARPRPFGETARLRTLWQRALHHSPPRASPEEPPRERGAAVTAAHKRALQAGRRRALAARRQRQIERVADYMNWLRAGAPLRTMPPLPRDADFRAARKPNR